MSEFCESQTGLLWDCAAIYHFAASLDSAVNAVLGEPWGFTADFELKRGDKEEIGLKIFMFHSQIQSIFELNPF